MRTILDKAITKANAARAAYEETGRLPAFESSPAPGGAMPSPSAATPPPAPKRVTAKEIDTALAERNAARSTQGLRPLTRTEYVKALKEKGYEVP